MNYPSIEIQNLISENLLESLGQENSRHKFAQPESFSYEINSVKEIKKNYASQIAEAYENLIVRWDLLSSDFPSMSLSDLREKWVKYFFSQFGFDLQYQKSAIEADSGNKFILSYRGWEGANAPIVHSSSFQQDLDDRLKEQTHKYSPHDTLQRFLNQSNSDLWGIVTNGRYLRILRDFSHQSRKAYIQFDLEILFEGRHYEDFRILYRLIHPSRFIPKEDEKYILENLFEESKSAGVAIGEDLRKNISLAIESLANGFLPATPDLLNRLVDSTENCMEFYQQILRIIYRILFLFYAEQRRLMPTRSTLYAQEYSMSSLRDKIERGEIIDEEQFDLWEGLKATFNMVYHGVPELGITPYNGQLFNPDSIHWLINSQCRNDKLLIAIKYMSLFEKEGIPHRISYIELNVDEIGAIYESLLEYIPRISSKMENLGDTNKKNKHNYQNEILPNTFFLDPRGTSRKTSGSYYTHPGLVNALIESALIPVVETKVEEAGPNKDNQEKALLSLKICDPACGSAAFLISATEYLGEKLAKIRIQDDYPNDTQIRHARRDILRHCIYGVDLNPMAVELAKVSLWLTAATNDLPLNFLDHKIKCGNSLISATPELIKKGIPPEAYSPVEGDDKNIARGRMKIAREYYKRKEQERNQLIINVVRESEEAQTFQVTDLSEKYGEDNTQEQKEIEKAYKKSKENYAFIKNKYIADFWTAAFFWKHNDDTKNYPTPMMLDYLLENETVQLSGELGNEIKKIAEEYKFFHWHLEFPEVFANGGFDCVLGNPPWERIKLQKKEFFSSLAPEIVNAPNASKRKKMIIKIKDSNPELNRGYLNSLRENESQSKFVRDSGKCPLTGKGDINTYLVFAGIFRDIINKTGRSGMVVPTGIATDYTSKDFFQDLVENKSVASLYDFINSKGIFPNVHKSYKFCLLTMTGKKLSIANTEFLFFLEDIDELQEKKDSFTLDKEEFALINPNTKTCPIFRTKKDADIVKKIYKNSQVLINDEENSNPWGIKQLRMFDMANDSDLFNTGEELIDQEFKLNGNIFEKDTEKYLPLYEGKMIWIYNHRASSIAYQEGLVAGRHDTIESKKENLQNRKYVVMPRLWVNSKDVISQINKDVSYFFGFRKIADSGNARTAIFSILPFSACGDSLPILLNNNGNSIRLLVANTSTFIFDYILRNKAGGNNISFYIVKQLPIILPDQYEENIVEYILPRVLELTYTAYDLKPFAEDCGYNGEPFEWDEDRRLELTTDLDALYGHLYKITKDELDYILETFPIVKKRDIEKYGEYRTKRLILEKYDELKDKFKNL